MKARFMLNFARSLTPASSLAYAVNKLRGGKAVLPLQLRSGIRFFLRPNSPENSDYGVAYEVFVNEDYRPPAEIDRAAVKLVIDIGGNVGFSALYWLQAFPHCSVEVFEPHPLHLVQMQKNLALAGERGQGVKVHAVAAGAASRSATLSSGGSSSMVSDAAEGAFAIEIADIFPLLMARTIDVLKLDAEGAEYEILADDRFGALNIRHLILEWHTRTDAEADRNWCEQRLTGMGYRLQPRAARPTEYTFWASYSRSVAAGRDQISPRT